MKPTVCPFLPKASKLHGPIFPFDIVSVLGWSLELPHSWCQVSFLWENSSLAFFLLSGSKGPWAWLAGLSLFFSQPHGPTNHSPSWPHKSFTLNYSPISECVCFDYIQACYPRYSVTSTGKSSLILPSYVSLNEHSAPPGQFLRTNILKPVSVSYSFQHLEMLFMVLKRCQLMWNDLMGTWENFHASPNALSFPPVSWIFFLKNLSHLPSP